MRRALAAAMLLSLPSLAFAADRPVLDARLSLQLPSDVLALHGLSVEGVRQALPRETPDVFAFRAATPAGLVAETNATRLERLGSGAVLNLEGGLALLGERGALALDGLQIVVPGAPEERTMQVRTVDGDWVLELRDLIPAAHEDGIHYRTGEVILTEAGARQLGRPEFAGAWLGGAELDLSTPHLAIETRSLEELPDPRGGFLDVVLGQLYGLVAQGHIGTYPNGTAGLSAATTSCNGGDVIVPWNAPMQETHPFIALAMFRLENGRLEQIGRNWMKHGFFALSNNQCDFGCPAPSNGTYLAIGCSDTYSAGNNGDRMYLGPREEIDPYLGVWEACGSYFDGTPADCNRSNFGSGLNSVAHRIEVLDSDLNHSGAQYCYEGAYFVANDQAVANNIGWRNVTATWTGSSWNISDPGNQYAFQTGARVGAFGSFRTSATAAADDGIGMLSISITDNGDGTWHYEYALYNRTVSRGLRSFEVGVSGATITNVEFRDIDQDPGNDWTATVTPGSVAWATDEYSIDPAANSMEYQMLYNFRFDADTPGALRTADVGIYRPGIGTSFAINAITPGPMGATDAPVAALGETGVSIEPNPFASSTRLSFSSRREGPARVTVLDVRGRAVRTLLDAAVPAGRSEVQWDGRDDAGEAVATGVYFVRVETVDGETTRKVTHLR
ncbi:MAG: FlgD immunoglobulin-like domain containing protein [bacterium]